MEINLKQIEGPFGPNLNINGQSYTYFSGTAYLGIPQHQGMQLLFQEGLSKFGLNNGTSRSNNVQLGIYDQAERHAAKFFQAEAALIISSGYLASYLAVKHFASKAELRYSPEIHPSLKVYPHLSNEPKQSFTAWAKQVIAEINSSKQDVWVLVSNSLNNLQPERFDFKVFEEIEGNKKIYFVVDDSHGIGVINGGLGIGNSLSQVKQIKWIVVASMAKALGIDAGVILSEEKIINELRENEIFLGASPPSAAALHAFIQGREIYAIEWLKLQKNMKLWEGNKVLSSDWQYIPELPVYWFKPGGLVNFLLEKKVLISSFIYPDKNGKLLDRLVLSSWHSPNDIQNLILSLNQNINSHHEK